MRNEEKFLVKETGILGKNAEQTDKKLRTSTKVNAMTIPNLPTDNLYKFIALSGVTIILVSILFYSSEIIELYDSTKTIESEIEILELDIEFFDEDVKAFESDVMLIDSSVSHNYDFQLDKVMKDKNLRDYFEFLFQYEDRIFPEKIKPDLIKSEMNRIDDLHREIRKKIKLVEIKNKMVNSKNNTLIITAVLPLFLIIIGWAMARYGFKQWYKMIQGPIDEKIAIELKNLREMNKKETT